MLHRGVIVGNQSFQHLRLGMNIGSKRVQVANNLPLSITKPYRIASTTMSTTRLATTASNFELVPPPWWVMFGIGTVGGTFGAILGLGGGVVITPAIVALTKVPQKMAIGTSLVAAFIVGGVGALNYGKEGLVDIVNALVIASGSALTAGVGARFAQGLPDRTLKTVLGIYMLVMAGVVPMRNYLLKSIWNDPNRETPAASTQIGNKSVFSFSWQAVPIFFVTGLFAGFASGLFGIAGGTIISPCKLNVHSFRLLYSF
jgi:uncharacterized membrane protein YfcA